MRKFSYAAQLSLSGVICLFLGACTETGKQVATPGKPAAVRPAEPDIIEKSRGPITTRTAPNATPRLRPSEGDRQRKPEPEQGTQPVAAKLDFHSLIGRSFEGVERLLGPADVTNDVPPGREWQYRDGPCTLVVRFFPDMKTLAYRVLSYTFEGGEGTSEQAGTAAGSGGNATGTSAGNGATNGASAAETQCRTRLASRLNRNGDDK